MFRRHEKNPLIIPTDINPSTDGFDVVGAFNPGATIYNSQVVLLLRVAEKCVPAEGKIRVPVCRFNEGKGIPEVVEFDASDPDVTIRDAQGIMYRGKKYLTSMSHIRLARSSDGINFKVDRDPFIYPACVEEEYGIEDARVTFLDGKYYINYTIVSTDSWCTALAVTDNFKDLKKSGIIFYPENKDVAIFPEKINDRYIALHRPNNSGFGKPSIWFAESPDLLHWGKHRCMVRPRKTIYESMKIGAGCAPIRTDKGWLCIYHAKGDNSRYTLFALLLNSERPWEVIKQGVVPLFEPEFSYETKGFLGNVVFTNGMVEKDSKLYIYYGAADKTTCLAFSTIEEILSSF